MRNDGERAPAMNFFCDVHEAADGSRPAGEDKRRTIWNTKRVRAFVGNSVELLSVQRVMLLQISRKFPTKGARPAIRMSKLDGAAEELASLKAAGCGICPTWIGWAQYSEAL